MHPVASRSLDSAIQRPAYPPAKDEQTCGCCNIITHISNSSSFFSAWFVFWEHRSQSCYCASGCVRNRATRYCEQNRDTQQRWPQIRNRLRQDFAFFADPDTESIFIFSSSSRSLHGLYKYHFVSTNSAEFRLHRWLPEFEQESDSCIWKNFGPDSKIPEQGRSQEPENVTSATSDAHMRSQVHTSGNWAISKCNADFWKN